jgi:hypothetical protein
LPWKNGNDPFLLHYEDSVGVISRFLQIDGPPESKLIKRNRGFYIHVIRGWRVVNGFVGITKHQKDS